MADLLCRKCGEIRNASRFKPGDEFCRQCTDEDDTELAPTKPLTEEQRDYQTAWLYLRYLSMDHHDRAKFLDMLGMDHPGWRTRALAASSKLGDRGPQHCWGPMPWENV